MAGGAWLHPPSLPPPPPPSPPPRRLQPQPSPSAPLQIARIVAAQRANREALAALKSGSTAAEAAQQPQQRWVARPGGLWLRLPADRAASVLRAGAARGAPGV